MMITLPFKILSRDEYDAKESYIDHLENMVEELQFQLQKYDRMRDAKGRFISDKDGLSRILKEGF